MSGIGVESKAVGETVTISTQLLPLDHVAYSAYLAELLSALAISARGLGFDSQDGQVATVSPTACQSYHVCLELCI